MAISENFLIKSCFKKARFKNEIQALFKARKHNQRAYFCHICGCWHLTSKPKIKK